jgi:hypothetical protein
MPYYTIYFASIDWIKKIQSTLKDIKVTSKLSEILLAILKIAHKKMPIQNE